eukprot:5920058-Prymnesium_polylepis.1
MCGEQKTLFEEKAGWLKMRALIGKIRPGFIVQRHGPACNGRVIDNVCTYCNMPAMNRRRRLLWVRDAPPLQRPEDHVRDPVRDARGRRPLRQAAEHPGDAFPRRARGAGGRPGDAAVQGGDEGEVGRGAWR